LTTGRRNCKCKGRRNGKRTGRHNCKSNRHRKDQQPPAAIARHLSPPDSTPPQATASTWWLTQPMHGRQAMPGIGLGTHGPRGPPASEDTEEARSRHRERVHSLVSPNREPLLKKQCWTAILSSRLKARCSQCQPLKDQQLPAAAALPVAGHLSPPHRRRLPKHPLMQPWHAAEPADQRAPDCRRAVSPHCRGTNRGCHNDANREGNNGRVTESRQTRVTRQ